MASACACGSSILNWAHQKMCNTGSNKPPSTTIATATATATAAAPPAAAAATAEPKNLEQQCDTIATQPIISSASLVVELDNSIELQGKCELLVALPDEILHLIFRQLSPFGLFRCRRVCSRLRDAVDGYLPSATVFHEAQLSQPSLRLTPLVTCKTVHGLVLFYNNKQSQHDDARPSCSDTDTPDPATGPIIMFSTRYNDKCSVDNQVEFAMNEGNLPLVKFVLSTERASNMQFEAQYLLPKALVLGQWEIEEYLATFFEDYVKRLSHVLTALGMACERSSLSRVKELMERKGLSLSKLSEETLRNLMEKACRGVRLENAQWLATACNCPVGNSQFAIRPFTVACKSGKLETAKWLAATFRITDEHARGRVEHPTMEYAFKTANFNLIKWLVETFHVTRAEIPQGLALYCMHSDNSEDSVATAEWLHRTMNFGPRSIWNNDYRVLRRVCESGNLDLAKWLTATFGLGRQSECSSYNESKSSLEALHEACRNGHLHVVQWLVETFGIPANLIRKYNFSVLTEAYKHKQMKTAEWLIQKFELTENEVAFAHTRLC